MANLKDLRNRINSVKSTQKITRAMQMVAASKLRRAQEAVSAARPYSERLERVMNSLAGSVQEVVGAPPLLAGTGENKTHLLIVATADRGLCGSFNVNIVRLATQHIAALEAEGKTVKILCVGKKGAAILQSRYRDQILEVIDLSHIRNIGFADSQPISAKVLEMFEAGTFDVCTLYFSRFGSIISQIPTAQRLIPMSVDSAQSEVTEDGAGASVAPSAIYEYEPDEREILEELLPRNIAFQIFRALLENAASEQGSRMSAMDNATRNAGELIDQLTLDYNRSRQGVITSELIEIISGAEAL